MQTITHAINIKDTFQYGWIAIGPESASAHMSTGSADPLSSVQKNAFAKLEEIKSEACRKSGIDIEAVNVRIHKRGHLALNYGNSYRTVISISDMLLQGIADRESKGLVNQRYLETYNSKIDALPDDPAELENQLEALTESEMYEWLGIDQKCRLWLNEDEIYFILKHELAGHSLHNDNAKRFTLTAAATIATIVGLPILLNISPESFFVGLALCIGTFAVMKLSVGRMINLQEYAADISAVEDDQKALCGGLRFLKKGMIEEEISKRLNPPLIRANYAGHPSFRDRYVELFRKSIR